MEEYDANCVCLYEKYYLNKKPQSTLYMRELMSVTDLLMSNSLNTIIDIEDKKRFDDFMFMKSLDSPLVNSFFNYICAFTSSKTQNPKYKSNLIIIGEFNIGSTLSVEMIT